MHACTLFRVYIRMLNEHLKFRILIDHVLEDPVHVVSDVGGNGRYPFGTASPWPEVDYSVLNVAACVRIRGLHRSAAVSCTSAHFVQTTDAKLLVPYVNVVSLVTLDAFSMWNDRNLGPEQLLTTGTILSGAPSGDNYLLESISNSFSLSTFATASKV